MRTWRIDEDHNLWAGEFLPPCQIIVEVDGKPMIVGYMLDPMFASQCVDACNAAEQQIHIPGNAGERLIIRDHTPEERRLTDLAHQP